MEKPERVQKIISNAGFCSRRKAEEFIEKGMVTVNGKRIKLGDKAVAGKDRIAVNGKQVNFERKIYIMLNKPKGFLTTVHDPDYRNTVMKLINVEQRVYPVGRLDGMSEGLLLFTNDGDFANKVTHPRYEIQKTYFVRLDKPIIDEDLRKIENGIEVEGRKTPKANIRRISENEFNIRIHEGRNRIIRNMMEALGYKIIKLVRMSIGKLSLGNLQQGKFRELKRREIDLIFS